MVITVISTCVGAANQKVSLDNSCSAWRNIGSDTAKQPNRYGNDQNLKITENQQDSHRLDSRERCCIYSIVVCLGEALHVLLDS